MPRYAKAGHCSCRPHAALCALGNLASASVKGGAGTGCCRAGAGGVERRVQERTVDLTMARDKLQAEILRHEQTGKELQSVQHDSSRQIGSILARLRRASRMRSISLWRPFAPMPDNARVLLKRKRAEEADENLENIAAH